MKKVFLAMLILSGALSAQAAEVVEKKSLVCVTYDEQVYGAAMVRYRTASSDQWNGTLFSAVDLKTYQQTGQLMDLGTQVATGYDGSYPEFTAKLINGSGKAKLYSCKTLTAFDRFSGEKEWYKLLKAYLY